jgi:predicted NBD/HSP70 family sugar kinase
VANLLNPEVIVLGGYFVPLAPWLLPAAEEELARRAVAPQAGGCRLVVASLGQTAAALGGAARVLDDVDAGHLPPPKPATAAAR